MLNAIDQIVRILALKALIEREGLQAGEADQIGVFDLLDGDPIATQQFGMDFDNLVQVENDRRVRDVQGRDRPFCRQRQRDDGTFAIHSVLVAVAVERCGLGHQKPIK